MSARARRVVGLVLIGNIVLMAVKLLAGWLGDSYALIADGAESAIDLIGGAIVWGGLRLAARPADERHPYGHGKAEGLAAAGVALLMLAAAGGIVIGAVHEISVPHRPPAPWTLGVLLTVIAIKEIGFRLLMRQAREIGSLALETEAWHHRGDALTSLAAAVGIAIALYAGPAYAAADDWAALLACAIIVINAWRLLLGACGQLMDRAAAPDLVADIRRLAGDVPGVGAIEKCRVRQSGLGLLLDIHVQVDGQLDVRQGHRIGHAVKDALMASTLPIDDVVVHLEPLPTP